MSGKKQRGIYLRGKKYWICYAGIDGKIIRESAGSSNKEVAEKLLRKRKAAIDEGSNPDIVARKQREPFAELSDRYDTWARRQDGYRTKKFYIRELRGVFGDVRIKDLSQEMLEFLQTVLLGVDPEQWPPELSFVRDRRKTIFKKEVYSASHINRLVSCFKHEMTKAAEWGYGKGLPEKFRRVTKLKENERTDNYSVDTCLKLIGYAKTIHHRVYVLIGLNAGCRNCEAMHLKWGDIDLIGRSLAFRPAYTKSRQLRVVPMNEALHRVLQEWRDQMKEKPKQDDWLFRDEKTGARVKSFRKAYSTMCRAVGIDCRYHALRHTFASRLAAKKVHVKVIADLIGDSVDTCMRYVHHDKSQKVSAVEEISLGGQEVPKQERRCRRQMKMPKKKPARRRALRR